MITVIMLVTWVMAGQPAQSYQVNLPTVAACEVAKTKILEDADRMARQIRTRPRNDAIPVVSVVCTNQGTGTQTFTPLSGRGWVSLLTPDGTPYIYIQATPDQMPEIHFPIGTPCDVIMPIALKWRSEGLMWGNQTTRLMFSDMPYMLVLNKGGDPIAVPCLCELTPPEQPAAFDEMIGRLAKDGRGMVDPK
jgi:hypothetical protein